DGHGIFVTLQPTGERGQQLVAAIEAEGSVGAGMSISHNIVDSHLTTWSGWGRVESIDRTRLNEVSICVAGKNRAASCYVFGDLLQYRNTAWLDILDPRERTKERLIRMARRIRAGIAA